MAGENNVAASILSMWLMKAAMALSENGGVNESANRKLWRKWQRNRKK
jgi:hypothetical protein